MAVSPADIDQLLDALIAGLPDDPGGSDTPRCDWVALAGADTPQRSPSRRYAERSGRAGVLVCRDTNLAEKLSALRAADVVLHAMAPLPALLASGQLPTAPLLFIETVNAAGNDLKLKLSAPPAFVVTALPERGWHRPWCSRRLQRRLGRNGYHCLAEGRCEAIYRHRNAIQATPPWVVSSRRATTAPTTPQLHIQTFDYWDTLITRWHPDPRVVFDYVGQRAGIENFRALRVDAERQARRRHADYDLEHIYDLLVEEGALPSGLRASIRDLELKAEEEFAQPVQANLDRLQAGDLVISDMYLTADQMRRIARAHVDLDRQPFLVSSGGKSNNSVWRELRKARISARHLGDRYMADYVGATSQEHQASLVRECSYSQLEKRFDEAGLVALANLMRLQRVAIPEARLRDGMAATGLDGLLTVQRRLNLPILYLVALELLQRGRGPDAPKHLLFCSRDCGYLHGIYRAMTEAFSFSTDEMGECELPVDHYFLTSRKAKARASPGYVAYCRSLLRKGSGERNVLVVDVQGSGKSSFRFFSEHLDSTVRQLFIHIGDGNLPEYKSERLLPQNLVRHLLPRASDMLEVLNYSCDHSLLDMHKVGSNHFVPEFEPENRPQKLREVCKAFQEFFHGVNQQMTQRPFQYLFLHHDLRNYCRQHFELLHDIDGLEDLRLLRELYLRFHRRH